MKFLCLGYFDREAMGALPQADIDALMVQCTPHMETFHGTGQVLVDAGLDLQAKSLRRRKGTLAVTDGPYIESKEMVGSAFLVEAADMEDAIRVASLHPATQVLAGEPFGWGLEIRPIHYFKSPDTPDVTWRPPTKSISRTITISLPVADLKASTGFYTALGFVINTQFTDESAALMVWSESISVMLLTHAKWRTFTTRPIPPKTSSEMGLTVSCDSRDEVDAMNKSAFENGGTADINPVQDHGFMYGRDFADPDGHVWGAVWMDMSAMPSSQ